MKLQKGDRVKLVKDMDHLPQGLKGRVLQISGSSALIDFEGEFATYTLDYFQIQEYIKVIR